MIREYTLEISINFTWNTTTWHCLKLKKFFAQKLHDLLLLMLLYQLLLLLLVVAAVPLLHLLHFHNVPCFISSAKVIVPLDSRIELSRSGGWVRRFAERISWAPWWHWGQSNDEESDALLIWLKVGFYMRWYILLVVVTSRFALTCWCFTFDGQKVLYIRRARRSKVPVAVFLIGHVSNVKPYTVVNLIIFQP